MKRKNQVSRGGPQDDVLVEKNGTDVGAYTIEPLGVIMGLTGQDFIPPVAGVGSFTVAQWLLNKFGGNLPAAVSRFSPLIAGLGGALLNGLALGAFMKNGKKVAAQAAATSLTMGIATQVLRETSGMGAVVMERISGLAGGRRAMGALPQVHGGGSMPRQIKQGLNREVYGKSWA